MDKLVLEAHKAATNALRSCRETHGLTVEKVEDTLDALSEVSSRKKGTRCLLPLALLCEEPSRGRVIGKASMSVRPLVMSL